MSVAGSGGSRDGPPEEDTYTTGQVARILGITDRGVRKMVDCGELEARRDDRGRHLIPQRAVHTLLEDRRASVSERSPASGAEISGGEATRGAEEARELRERVEALQRELGRLEGRLELTERTESTMREERDQTPKAGLGVCGYARSPGLSAREAASRTSSETT